MVILYNKNSSSRVVQILPNLCNQFLLANRGIIQSEILIVFHELMMNLNLKENESIIKKFSSFSNELIPDENAEGK